MNDTFIEVCVDSVESAVEASLGGADRLELCSNLVIGGTTPSVALFQQVRNRMDLPIHVLIRPRFGDFCYNQYEVESMVEEIKMFQSLGADGIVVGMLTEDGALHKEHMKDFMMEAKDMKVTLHRAFDMCKDPIKTLGDAIETGVDMILTSGCSVDCVKGAELIKELVLTGGELIRIMAGGGMHAGVAEQIYKHTGIKDFHLSGKVTKMSKMKYRNEDVCMGLPAMSEYEIWMTDAQKIADMRQTLNRIFEEG